MMFWCYFSTICTPGSARLISNTSKNERKCGPSKTLLTSNSSPINPHETLLWQDCHLMMKSNVFIALNLQKCTKCSVSTEAD